MLKPRYMRSLLTLLLLPLLCTSGRAQLSPAITSWLQNNTETGTYYIAGNSTLIDNDILVNCQKVEYSDGFVYVTLRTEHADGTDVADGPAVSTTYPIGYFREDYGYVESDDEDVLDVHNGRFCVTPEYPEGTYAYFATVNTDWTSAYPYAVGPTYAGFGERRNVDAVTEATTVYEGTTPVRSFADEANITVFPNPSSDLIAVQIPGLAGQDHSVQLLDANGRLVREKTIRTGQTIAYFDTQTLYRGVYFVRISSGGSELTRKVVVE